MNTRLLCVASLLVFVLSFNVIQASVTPTDRDDYAQAWSVVGRRNATGTIVTEANIFNQIQETTTVTPLTADLLASGSGTFFDTATGTQMVATGSGSVSLHSVATLSGSDLAAFEISGSINSTLTTGTLAGYNPPGGQPIPYASPKTLYFSSLGMMVTTSTPFTLSIGFTNAVGMDVARVQLYNDTNNDGMRDFSESQIAAYDILGNQVSGGSGVLAPSATPYRVEFVGGIVDNTTADNFTLNNSVDFTDSLVLPEPSSIAIFLAPFSMILKRRRRF